MSPREKGRYLRERGWIMVGDAPRLWRDPVNAMAGAISTDEAVARQRERETRVEVAREKARKR